MKLWKCICITSAIILLSVSNVSTSFANTMEQSSTKRYIVKFKASSVANSIDRSQVISKHSGKVRHQFKHINAAVADMTTQGLTDLNKDPNVDYIEEDHVLKISSTSYSDWGVSDIKAPTAWQSGLTGKGVKIAIIDTGAGPHSDLIVSGGTNVISNSTTTSYKDDNGHGTHVAGIIAAQGLNGGVEGVAPGASIFAVKALDSSGSGYTSDIISGIDWAIDNGMNIINMSLGSSQTSTSLQNAVDTAYKDGLLIVAAAGNDGNSAGSGTNVEYPANYSSVIAVAAVDSTHQRASFSSTGSKVEVSAPGVNIISTYLNGGYAKMSGTSMATPFVAGDLALLKQEYPNDTNVQLRQLLDKNIIDLGVTGRDPLYGYGLIVAPSNITTVTPATPATPATPTASIVEGTYASSQTVSLNDATAGVSIYYTTDGTTPTSKSNLYTVPITISSTETLKAIAIDTKGNSSSVLSVSYIIAQSVVIPTPTANIASGSYKSPIIVQLYDNYSKPLVAYYSLDGSEPTTKSIPYTGFIKITSTCTLKAIAVDNLGNKSGVLSNTYKIITPPANPVISKKSGLYKSAQTITMSDSTPGVSIYYTTDKSIPTAKSTLYTGPITIKTSKVIAAIAIDSSGNSSGVVAAEYFISGR